MVRGCCQFAKSNGGIDVIAQHRLCDFYLASKQAFDTFSQKLPAKGGVALCTRLDGFLKISRQCHLLGSLFLPYLVILPSGDRVLDVSLLTFLAASTKQNDDAFSVPPKIDSVAWTKVDSVLKHS